MKLRVRIARALNRLLLGIGDADPFVAWAEERRARRFYEAKIEALEALGHGIGDNALGACADPECSICAVLDCLHAEPLHHHHDGCPACSQNDGCADA